MERKTAEILKLTLIITLTFRITIATTLRIITTAILKLALIITLTFRITISNTKINNSIRN